MKERAAPDYASVSGNLGCYFLRRLDDDAAHFLLITLWESMDAIKEFAGPDPEVAKYYPEDEDLLLEKEPNSQLYEVFHKSVGHRLILPVMKLYRHFSTGRKEEPGSEGSGY
jgi:heme-degrading monooxygenase HmoA